MELEHKVRWAEHLKILSSAIFSLTPALAFVTFAYYWGPANKEPEVALWVSVLCYLKFIALGFAIQVGWYVLYTNILKELKKEEEILESEKGKEAKKRSQTKSYH